MRWFGVFVLLMVGCGSVPVTPSSATVAPGARILAFQDEAGKSDGSVIVLRDTGFTGKSCFNSVYINGTLSARLAVAEKAHFVVEAGEVTLSVGKDPYGNKMCQMHQGEAVTQTITLAEGEARLFRLAIDSGGKLILAAL